MIHPRLLSRPRLKAADAPFSDAFHALNASRSGGMGGPNPIPVSEVLSYLQLMGIASISARSKYLRLIQKMDQTYLKHAADKAEQQNRSKT